MGDRAQDERLRVNGYVEHGSIVRNGAAGELRPASDSRYAPARIPSGSRWCTPGIDPLPDTFKDDAQALADGKLGAGRRVSRQQDPGQVRVEVRSQATNEDGREPAPGM